MTTLPEFLQIEPVGQCNLRCQMCAIQFRKDGPPHGPPAFLDFELFGQLLDGFPTARELHLQGLGEPMMHPWFFDMVELAVGRGLRVSTNSNLTLLTPQKAGLCVTSGLSSIHVSIDGAQAKTYESIRIRSSFKKVMENLQSLQKAKVQHESASPSIKIICVLMRRTLPELPELCYLARENGVTEIFVQHLCHDFGEETLPEHYAPMREFINSETLAGEDLERIQFFFGRALKAARDCGIKLRLPNLQPKALEPENGISSYRSNCDWPWRGAYIAYSGEVMPCCMISTPDRLNFGKIAKAGDVTAIWNSPRFEYFRSRLDSPEPAKICRSCSVLTRTF